jgi:hypothetical protein
MIILNLIWPAIYVYDELWKFWYLVFATILIETLAIKALLNYPLKKSFWISIIGNLISGIIGSFVMMYGMLLWDAFTFTFLSDSNFDKFNRFATYFLMCIGSVIIETLAIKLILKEKFIKLLVPLLIGNALTYCFIAYSITLKNQKECWTENIYYKPSKNNFKLLDGTKLLIFTSKVDVKHNKDDKVLDSLFTLEVLFEKENPDDFQFNLKIIGNEDNSGIGIDSKQLYITELTDTIKVELYQSNPDTNYGWIAPLTTDTINFIKKTNKNN